MASINQCDYCKGLFPDYTDTTHVSVEFYDFLSHKKYANKDCCHKCLEALKPYLKVLGIDLDA